MNNLLTKSLFIGLFFPLILGADHARDMQESLELFKSDIRPFLIEQCLECHGGKKVKSAFNLNSRNGLLAGGDQGVAIKLGEAAESPMLAYMQHREEPYMPPKKPRVSEEIVVKISRWIDLGAAYDEPLGEELDTQGPMQVTDEDKQFWSFAPLQHAAPPKVSQSAWAKNPIDQFIGHTHEKKKLTPAAALDKRSLIRRASFDVIGLPPTPEEVAAFVADDSPDAYSRMVDSLLANAHYGERWARHWLDVARFAESHGFEHDYDRKHAYQYRDFMIMALNQDMPWDQMVQWQLAGDELAPEDPLAMMATGFLGAGVYPTQITVAEAERIRYDAIDDMVSTMGSAMLGLTIGCSRCHDHKFDPIPTLDYYRLASAFTATVRSDIDVAVPMEPGAAKVFEEQLDELLAQRTAFEKTQLVARLKTWATENAGDPKEKMSLWNVMNLGSFVSAAGATMARQADRSILVTGTNSANDTYTVESKTNLKQLRAFRIEALADKSMIRNGPGRASNGNFGLSNVTLAWRPAGSKNAYVPTTLSAPRATFEQNKANLSIASTIDKDGRSGWAVDPQFGKNHAAIYTVDDGGKGEQEVEVKVVLTFTTNGQHNFGRFRLSVSDAPAAGLPLQDDGNALQLAEREVREHLKAGNQQKALDAYKALDSEWLALDAAITAHKATSSQGKKMKVMVCAEGYKPMRHHVADGSIKDFYSETYVLHRGDISQKQDVATLSYLQVLMRSENLEKRWHQEPVAGAKGSFRRASLAHWITDTEQGAGHLLARVIVNRLWQHHFGVGLVATSNDFGASGARPSHPALLDWLAQELIRADWQLKPIHKLIMSSATYQMGGSTHAGNQRIDPDNRFVWKRDPRRLEAEAIRDHLLAVSNQLDPTPYGPGTLSESHRRRSIYFMLKRSKLIPFLQVFDFPDTLNSLGRRAVTTTSSQALVFMNHPEVRKMAEAFAQRVEQADGDPVELAYDLAFGRAPSPQEQEFGTQFIQQASLADFCQALMSMNEFIFIP